MEEQNPIIPSETNEPPIIPPVMPPLSQVQPEAPITTPPQEAPKSPKSFLKWFVIALIILLTGTTGFLTFQVLSLKKQIASRPTPTAQPPEVKPSPTPTPDPTADWKKYINKLYRFSVNYPRNWSVLSESIPYGYSQERGKFELSLGRTTLGNIENEPEQITIMIFNLKNINHLYEYNRWLNEAEASEEVTYSNHRFIKYKNVTVNNNPDSYKKLDYYTTETNDKTLGAKIMVGSWLSNYTSDEIDENILNQILSTFQFTE